MCVYFCSVISLNKIAELSIDTLIWAWILDSIIDLRVYLIEKIQILVEVYHELYSNGAEYLKIL